VNQSHPIAWHGAQAQTMQFTSEAQSTQRSNDEPNEQPFSVLLSAPSALCVERQVSQQHFLRHPLHPCSSVVPFSFAD
jgi:hypothetical protein